MIFCQPLYLCILYLKTYEIYMILSVVRNDPCYHKALPSVLAFAADSTNTPHIDYGVSKTDLFEHGDSFSSFADFQMFHLIRQWHIYTDQRVIYSQLTFRSTYCLTSSPSGCTANEDFHFDYVERPVWKDNNILDSLLWPFWRRKSHAWFVSIGKVSAPSIFVQFLGPRFSNFITVFFFFVLLYSSISGGLGKESKWHRGSAPSILFKKPSRTDDEIAVCVDGSAMEGSIPIYIQ